MNTIPHNLPNSEWRGSSSLFPVVFVKGDTRQKIEVLKAISKKKLEPGVLSRTGELDEKIGDNTHYIGSSYYSSVPSGSEITSGMASFHLDVPYEGINQIISLIEGGAEEALLSLKTGLSLIFQDLNKDNSLNKWKKSKKAIQETFGNLLSFNQNYTIKYLSQPQAGQGVAVMTKIRVQQPKQLINHYLLASYINNRDGRLMNLTCSGRNQIRNAVVFNGGFEGIVEGQQGLFNQNMDLFAQAGLTMIQKRQKLQHKVAAQQAQKEEPIPTKPKSALAVN